MLPPVAALSDTALSQFNQPQYLPTSSRVQIGHPRGDAATGPLASPAAFATDRRDVLSLSGQLQLAQGLSSVAEAVGSVLKLTRHEGETLTDYADRLAETIAALPPAERVALQRVLMQLIKGVTLRLLVDILKNPFGPEATRLSLQLETEAATERDPVTKLVVTSYRQNDGSGAAMGPQNRPALAVGAAAMAAAALPQLAGQTPAETAAQPQGTMATGASHAPGTGPTDPSSEQDAPAQVFTTKGGQPGTLATALETPPSHPLETAGPEFGTLPALQGGPAESRGLTGGHVSQAHASAHPEAGSQVEPRASAPGRADPSAARTADQAQPARDEVTYDGPALARQGSQRLQAATLAAVMRSEQASVGGSRAATSAPLLALAARQAAAETAAPQASDRYAAIFAGDSFGDEFSFIGDTPAPAASASTSPARSAPAGPVPPASLPAEAAVPVAGAFAAPSGAMAGAVAADERAAAGLAAAEAETQAANGEMAGMPSSAEASRAAGVTAEQATHPQDGPSFVAGRTMSATAFVPPFVPYPVSSPAADGRGDLVRAVEAVDEDGRSGRRKHGRDQGAEDEAADEERSDDELSASDAQAAPEAAEADADARNLPPTAHLAGDRHGEAQDFYQRLAAW